MTNRQNKNEFKYEKNEVKKMTKSQMQIYNEALGLIKNKPKKN